MLLAPTREFHFRLIRIYPRFWRSLREANPSFLKPRQVRRREFHPLFLKWTSAQQKIWFSSLEEWQQSSLPGGWPKSWVESVGQAIGYQFRFEKWVRTRELFFLQKGCCFGCSYSDPTLAKVGAVILDEFHQAPPSFGYRSRILLRISKNITE